MRGNYLHLSKLPRCKKYLLTTDSNPRCLAVAKITFDSVIYHGIEVDTSDADKPLSTKLLQINYLDNFELGLKNWKSY